MPDLEAAGTGPGCEIGAGHHYIGIDVQVIAHTRNNDGHPAGEMSLLSYLRVVYQAR
jgi:hypothetical protein